jgi:hypothetical protein
MWLYQIIILVLALHKLNLRGFKVSREVRSGNFAWQNAIARSNAKLTCCFGSVNTKTFGGMILSVFFNPISSACFLI